MIEHIGENLIAGKIGEFLVILSFVSSLLATVFYIKSSSISNDLDSSKNLGRLFYRLHSISLISLIPVNARNLQCRNFNFRQENVFSAKIIAAMAKVLFQNLDLLPRCP